MSVWVLLATRHLLNSGALDRRIQTDSEIYCKGSFAMRWFYLIVVVLFVAATVIFSIQNLHVVDISFLGMSVHTRLAFLIAGIYVLGAISGGSLLALLRQSFDGARLRGN